MAKEKFYQAHVMSDTVPGTLRMLFLPSYEMYIVPNNYCRKKRLKTIRDLSKVRT